MVIILSVPKALILLGLNISFLVLVYPHSPNLFLPHEKTILFPLMIAITCEPPTAMKATLVFIPNIGILSGVRISVLSVKSFILSYNKSGINVLSFLPNVSISSSSAESISCTSSSFPIPS